MIVPAQVKQPWIIRADKSNKSTATESKTKPRAPSMEYAVHTSWAPFHERVFHRNSVWMEISFYSHPSCNTVIVMKFCTCHASCDVVTCAKACSDMFPYNGVTLNLPSDLNHVGKSFVEGAPDLKPCKSFPHDWPFVRRTGHRWNKGPVMRNFDVSLLLTWPNWWTNSRVTGDFIHYNTQVSSLQWKFSYLTSYTSSSSFCTNRSQCQRSLIWTKPLLKGPEAEGVGRLPPPIIRCYGWIDTWSGAVKKIIIHLHIHLSSKWFCMLRFIAIVFHMHGHFANRWLPDERSSYQAATRWFWRNNDVTIASRAPPWVQTTCTYFHYRHWRRSSKAVGGNACDTI